ncbi:MAG: hypothetical protein ACYCYL_02000 [Acidithiobacillus sp.]
MGEHTPERDELETVQALTHLLQQQKAWLAHADWGQGLPDAERRNFLARRLSKLRAEIAGNAASAPDLSQAVCGLQEAYSELDHALRLASAALREVLALLQGQKVSVYGDHAGPGRSLGSA